MKIEYIGFLPFIIFYLWGTLVTYSKRDQSFDFTFYRAIFVFGTLFLMIAGMIWGFEG